MAEQETNSELESDQKQLDAGLLFNMESNKELLDSPWQVYSVTISKFPTSAEFPIEIQGCKTNSLFDTGVQISCISYDCYREFTLKTKIYTKVKAKVDSAD